MEQIKLNTIPSGVPSVCHISQFDNTSRIIRCHLFNGSDPLTLTGSETIRLFMRKSNNSRAEFEIESTSGAFIDLVITSEMSDIAGDSECKFQITDSEKTIGTLNFKMVVEPDAYGDSLKTRSVSGPIATFETDLAEDLVKLDVDINPVQDLHGYDHPWIGGAGKNLCPPVTIGKGYNATTGEPTTSDTQASSAKFPFDKDKTYTFTKNCDVNFMIFAWDSEGNFVGRTAGANTSPKIFTKDSFSVGSGTRDYDSITQIALRFYQATGQDINDVTDAEYQVEEGESATEWTPYENICPVTGWDEENVTHTSGEMSAPVSLDFGQTVYGGTIDLTTGLLRITHGYVDLATYNGRVNKLGSGDSVYFRFDNVLPYPYPRYSSIICDKFTSGTITTSTSFIGVSVVKPSNLDHATIAFRPENPSIYTTTTILDYIQSLGSLEVVYELATPIEVQLTPQQIEAFIGTNVIYADTGDVDVKYYTTLEGGND